MPDSDWKPGRVWLPGDLVIVLESTLVSRLNSNAEQFTRGLQLALIIQQSNQWAEPSDPAGGSHTYYTVFFNNEPNDPMAAAGFYYVPGNCIIHPDEANNPARLFGSRRLQE
jgi:hypothetical protein